jgi:hypothetical protein
MKKKRVTRLQASTARVDQGGGAHCKYNALKVAVGAYLHQIAQNKKEALH